MYVNFAPYAITRHINKLKKNELISLFSFFSINTDDCDENIAVTTALTRKIRMIIFLVFTLLQGGHYVSRTKRV